jgi:hypothetical protein
MNIAAENLARSNRWNDIFEGSIFTIYGIVWNSEDATSSGVNNSKSKWLTAATIDGSTLEGYKWTDVQTTNSQLMGIHSPAPNSFGFRPHYNNPKALLASWKYDAGTASCAGTVSPDCAVANRMIDYTSSSVTPSTQWVADYETTVSGMLIINSQIKNPTVPLVKGTVTTFYPGSGGSSIGIYFVSPGRKLQAEYCSIISNLTMPVCISWCSSNPNSCAVNQLTLCMNVDNISSEYCQAYCATNNANCDAALKPYCESQLQSTASNDINSFMAGDYGNMCACFLPDITMNGLATSIQDAYGVYTDKGSANCYFPMCSQNVDAIKPKAWKLMCGNCPNKCNCITSVSINYQGAFESSPEVQNAPSCTEYGAIAPFTSVITAAPNACKAKITPGPKIKHRGTNSAKNISIGIFVFSAVIVVSIGGYYVFKKLKNK